MKTFKTVQDIEHMFVVAIITGIRLIEKELGYRIPRHRLKPILTNVLVEMSDEIRQRSTDLVLRQCLAISEHIVKQCQQQR